ncbi:MAG TPA: Ig-like domain-containing protein [Pedococcus sp.]|nr:Ig-like domain-containing protein [Pedococcus sp.]
MRLRGKVTDYGDLLHHEEWVIKGRRLNFVWHIGPALDTTPADRESTVDGSHVSTERIDLIMDLQSDKRVTLTASYTDEMGNPTTAPDGATVTYTVDDTSIINLTDNGDGSAVAAATGTLGTATVHGEASFNGQTVSGDLQIVVVAGLAERFEITAGEPEEITPDGGETPPPA